jgi:ABC-2 type transport system ATP-binding protein
MQDTGHAGAQPSDALVVETRDLVRTFGAQRAIDGLTLAVKRGECVGLLGPNGAGKTTTIRVLATLCAASSGIVRVLGLDPSRAAAAIRARIGVVPQEIALYDALSARENLEFFGRLQGLRDERLRSRVEWALREAGLADRARDRVETYSGGMKRRLNIVTALLHEPELVFLDEPTVGIDPQSRLHVFEMVEAMRASGIALVYTTHQLGEVERLCDRIVILDRGRLVAQGTLAELQSLGGVARRQWARFAIDSSSEDVVRALTQRGIACEVEDDSAGLEEIFLGLTGRALRDEP